MHRFFLKKNKKDIFLQHILQKNVCVHIFTDPHARHMAINGQCWSYLRHGPRPFTWRRSMSVQSSPTCTCMFGYPSARSLCSHQHKQIVLLGQLVGGLAQTFAAELISPIILTAEVGLGIKCHHTIFSELLLKQTRRP